MVEDDMIIQRVGDTQPRDTSVSIPFDKRYPRNIWVDKRQAVYDRIDTLHVPAEVKNAMRDAVTSVIEISAWCMRERIPFRFVLRLADKKCLQILKAESKEEVNKVLSLVRMSKDAG